MFKRKCKITFISHGATIYSTAGIIGNDLKYPKLNDFGEDEINKVCEYLKERGVAYDNIYTCPNACCSQSAQVIASLFKQKVKTLELLPRNYGKWHGLLYSDILKNNGPEVLAQTPEDGEPLKDFNNRVSEIIYQLVSENIGNRIILVATTEIIQSALANALNVSAENQYKFLIKTGSLTQISYFDNWASVIYSDYRPI